jgi:tetratricopeptide (TPR) repeat protein
MNRKQLCSIALFFLCASYFYAGQSAGALAKMGDKAVAQGKYYSGAISYLDALAKKPKDTKTLQKLSGVALPAYDQKLKLAEEYRSSGNLEGAIREFRELEGFVEKLRQYKVVDFVTIDFASTFSTLSDGAAETRYKNAEGYFVGQNFDKAIEEYKAALGLKSPYKNCLDKISESYYNIGLGYEKIGAYRKAAETYKQSYVTVSTYKDARKKAVSIYYALGDYFLGAGQFRKAFEDYSLAYAVDPQYSGLVEKLSRVKDLATIRLAFARFDNATGVNIGGIALGDVIMETIKSKIQSEASQFIRILDREELSVLAQEQRISEGQINDNMSMPLKLEGVQYLLFGKLNQVRDVRPGRTVDRLTARYQYSYEVPYTDSKGRQRSDTKWAWAPMTFDLVKESFTLYIGGIFKAVAVKTGAVAVNKQFSQEGGDNIAYATNIQLSTRHRLDDVILDNEVSNLINAKTQLQDSGGIVNNMILSISDTIVSSLLSMFDQAPNPSDPVSLKY